MAQLTTRPRLVAVTQGLLAVPPALIPERRPGMRASVRTARFPLSRRNVPFGHRPRPLPTPRRHPRESASFQHALARHAAGKAGSLRRRLRLLGPCSWPLRWEFQPAPTKATTTVKNRRRLGQCRPHLGSSPRPRPISSSASSKAKCSSSISIGPPIMRPSRRRTSRCH